MITSKEISRLLELSRINLNGKPSCFCRHSYDGYYGPHSDDCAVISYYNDMKELDALLEKHETLWKKKE